MERSSPAWTKTQRFTGGNHGGKRQFIGLPGQLTQLVDGEVPRLIGTLDNSTKIDVILGNGWVETHIIAKNNVLIHITNGHVTSVVTDDDDKNRPTEGGNRFGMLIRAADEGGIPQHPVEDDRTVGFRAPARQGRG